jgi:hypothetical protein
MSSYSREILTAHQEMLHTHVKAACEDLHRAKNMKNEEATKDLKAALLKDTLRTIGNWICENTTKGTDEYQALW